METIIGNKIKFNVIQTISIVYDASKGSKLSKALFKKIEPRLDKLSEYFNVSPVQAFLMANITVIYCDSKYFDLIDLGRHFGCNMIKLLKYQHEIDSLVEKGLLIKRLDRFRNPSAKEPIFHINKSVITSITNNIELPELSKIAYKDLFEVLDKLYALGKEREEGNISTVDLLENTMIIIDNNIHIPFVLKVKNMELKLADTYLFLYLCWKTITGNETTDLNTAVDGIFDKSFEKSRFVQKILSKENKLIVQKYIELEEGIFFNDSEIKLSKKSIELLKMENITLFSKRITHDNIITPEKIDRKELFFSPAENRQIEMLVNMLKDGNLLSLQQRLVQKSMSPGIAVLLYGAPGTGKTESVHQLARKSNREIMHVDISQSKSMWFGGSEKKIKQIFTNYNEFVNQSERCPILLFNEADAIFSKRKDSSSSNVAQTENAMQNIILEQMENFKGVLFATTNLTGNMDSAFERRFLFKIEFSNPDTAIRSQIWKSKITYMPEQECEILAGKFNFSGGQIDNIARKCEMYEVLNGLVPGLAVIMEFCKEEMICKEHFSSIGFKINNN